MDDLQDVAELAVFADRHAHQVGPHQPPFTRDVAHRQLAEVAALVGQCGEGAAIDLPVGGKDQGPLLQTAHLVFAVPEKLLQRAVGPQDPLRGVEDLHPQRGPGEEILQEAFVQRVEIG